MSGREETPSERSPAVGEEARRALVSATAELCLRLAAAKRRNRSEGIHKLRVSARRLDAALDAFRDALRGRDLYRRTRAAAAELRARLGAVRDLDVEVESMRELAREFPAAAPVVAALEAELNARRPAAEATLDEALDRVETDLLPLLAGIVARAAGRKGAASAVRRRVARRWRRLLAQIEAAHDREAGPLHDVRKAAKRLRYVLEVAGPLALGRSAEAPIASLKELQDLLGQIHDLDVLAGRLLSTGDAAAPPEADEPARSPEENGRRAVPALTAHIAARRGDLTRRLDEALAPARLDDLAHRMGLA